MQRFLFILALLAGLSLPAMSLAHTESLEQSQALDAASLQRPATAEEAREYLAGDTQVASSEVGSRVDQTEPAAYLFIGLIALAVVTFGALTLGKRRKQRKR